MFNLHYTGGSEENPSPEVVNATEPLGEAETSLCVTSTDGVENSKARKRQGGDQSDEDQQQKDSFSVAHLPSQVWLPSSNVSNKLVAYMYSSCSSNILFIIFCSIILMIIIS